MLAQNFKTPTDLGIANAEFDALVKVLGMLEREEATGFTMQHFKHECGSPACICGWAHHVSLGVAFPELKRHIPAPALRVRLSDEIIELFDVGLPRRPHATSAQAAIALRNYLTFGEPRWDEALATSTL